MPVKSSLAAAELAPWDHDEVSPGGDFSAPSANSLLREAMGCFDEKGALQHRPGIPLDKANYQLALVPLPKVANQSVLDAPVLANVSPVVMLPLTWKDLVTRLRFQGGRNATQANDVVVFSSIWIKFSSMEVRRAGNLVTMTPLEFKLLRYFIFNPRTVISRDELLNRVWGFENYPCTRTVDTHVWRLRQKLEIDPVRPAHFITVHAMGYKFVS